MKWNASAVSGGLEFIEKHEKDCLAYLKLILDEYHGVNRSLDYYNILCGDWLMNFLHLLYAASVECQEQKPIKFRNYYTITSDSFEFGQESIRSTRFFEELKENTSMIKITDSYSSNINMGEIMHKWAYDLFPICRSITGKGIKKTLRIIKNEFPKLKIYYFSSGKKVFDWKIPSEWNIKNAYILDKNNKKIINFKKIICI